MQFFRVIFSSVFSIIIFLFVFIPVYIWRGFVKIILAKCLLPQNAKIVDAGSAIFAPTNCTVSSVTNVVLSIVIKGEFNNKDLLACLNKVGEKNAEFSSYPTIFCGFAYWIPDKVFSISNHVSYLFLNADKQNVRIVGIQNEADGQHSELCSEEELNNLKKFVIMETYPAKKSPWNIYVVKNVDLKGKQCTVLLLKFHHGLSDGMSMWKVARWSSSNDKTNQPTTTLKKMGLLADAFITIKAIIGIYNVLFGTAESHAPATELSNNRELCWKDDWFILDSEDLQIPDIKRIKDLHSVPFAAITLYGFTTAVRNYYKERGMEPPAGIGNSFYPFPFPNHPDNKVTNHWTFSILPLPIDEDDDEVRLQRISQLLKNAKRDAAVTFKVIRLFGSLFNAWQRPIDGLAFSFSDFPGTTEKITGFGGEWSDVSYYLHFLAGKQVMVPTAISYDGAWKLSLLALGSAFGSAKEGHAFIKSILQSIRDLELIRIKVVIEK